MRYFVILALLTGCGVKGNPEPPETPPQLGRGQPTYNRATREFAQPDLPPAPPEASDDEESRK